VKLVNLAVFGAGYLLGTKAGRERYEQIVKAAQNSSKRLEAYGSGGSLAADRGTDSGRPASDGGTGQE